MSANCPHKCDKGAGVEVWSLIIHKKTLWIYEGLGTTFDDHRYLEIAHLSTTIFIHEFKEQVKARYPESTVATHL